MRLIVRHKGQVVNELRFREGPIYIGRQMGSQVFLPDRSVSRQHAVIYVSGDGSWVLEDLDSANKTFLNRNPIHKHSLKENDSVNIGDFSIKVFLNHESEDRHKTSSIHLDDTVAGMDSQVITEVRLADAPGSSMIKLPARRTQDFLKFSRILCSIRSFNQLHRQILDIMFGQFTALEVWVGLRMNDKGDLDVQGGRKVNTETLQRGQLIMASKITEAMDKSRYILVPQFPRGQIRSAIIAPIMSGRKCYGAIYVSNSKQYKPYDMTDLDYLMFLTIQIAAIIETI